jgi:hypothetical protein
MGDEKFRNRFRPFRGHHQIEIVHNFFSAPITPRNIGLESIGMPEEIAPHCFRFAGDLAELKVTGMFCPFLDRFTDPGLCGLAEAGQFDPRRWHAEISCATEENRQGAAKV